MKMLAPLLLLIACLNGCGISPKAYTDTAPVQSPVGASDAELERELEQRAEAYIRARLKNPYSAKVHSNIASRVPTGSHAGFRTVKADERLFRCFTEVEATNSYGAMIVDRYETVARYNEEKRRWEILDYPTAMYH